MTWDLHFNKKLQRNLAIYVPKTVPMLKNHDVG